MFLKKDCEKRVQKAADAAKAKMKDAKSKMTVAENKLSKVKQMAKSIDKYIKNCIVAKKSYTN